jgi:hypothetical protein
MPIKQRPRLNEDYTKALMLREDVRQAFTDFRAKLEEAIGDDFHPDDLSVTVVVEYAGRANILTDVVDYDHLTDTLQSIVAKRGELGPVEP